MTQTEKTQFTDNQNVNPNGKKKVNQKNNSSNSVAAGLAGAAGAAAGVAGATFIPTAVHAAETDHKNDDAEVVSSETDHATTAPTNGGQHHHQAAPHHTDDGDAHVVHHEPSDTQTHGPSNIPGGVHHHDTNPEPQPAPQPQPEPHPENPEEPTVEVLDYQHVSDGQGNEADVAVVSINGQPTGIADTTMDGYANVAFADANGNGQLDEDEVIDVTDQHIAMQPFHDAAPTTAGNDIDPGADPDNTLVDNGPDYVNDGNVDDYMA